MNQQDNNHEGSKRSKLRLEIAALLILVVGGGAVGGILGSTSSRSIVAVAPTPAPLENTGCAYSEDYLLRRSSIVTNLKKIVASDGSNTSMCIEFGGNVGTGVDGVFVFDETQPGVTVNIEGFGLQDEYDYSSEKFCLDDETYIDEWNGLTDLFVRITYSPTLDGNGNHTSNAMPIESYLYRLETSEGTWSAVNAPCGADPECESCDSDYNYCCTSSFSNAVCWSDSVWSMYDSRLYCNSQNKPVPVLDRSGVCGVCNGNEDALKERAAFQRQLVTDFYIKGREPCYRFGSDIHPKGAEFKGLFGIKSDDGSLYDIDVTGLQNGWSYAGEESCFWEYWLDLWDFQSDLFLYVSYSEDLDGNGNIPDGGKAPTSYIYRLYTQKNEFGMVLQIFTQLSHT
eukprot:CAMPEP_0113615466 /NCGR_PEP_ID=MMETSP0017_2-20120614/7713_1 /TAXON_ID=2856 /ORGANISM="Cylindrotheca closterium" /LENGTH=397 /DNA_ID=CAMNT_0000524699 /DNA_START=353 /DNA_END=1546 /DNA_ORIENTATION=+ /assembly_acc=CAM_ASM_000147